MKSKTIQSLKKQKLFKHITKKKLNTIEDRVENLNNYVKLLKEQSTFINITIYSTLGKTPKLTIHPMLQYVHFISNIWK